MFRKHVKTIECFVSCISHSLISRKQIPNSCVQLLDLFMVKPLTQETVIAHHRYCTILFHL